MSTTTPFSSLASIVPDPEDTDTWRKLQDSKPLVKLHAKFWGKGMVQEEASGQTSYLSEREAVDIDESIEDDTKSGYVLVLDNEAFPNRKIWVRVSAFTQGEIGTVFTKSAGGLYPYLRLPRKTVEG